MVDRISSQLNHPHAAVPSWPRAQVLGWLHNSLAFAKASIPYLAVLQPKNQRKSPDFKREKFISETAILLYASAPAGKLHSSIQAAVKDIALLLSPHARSEAILTSMRLRPMIAPELAVAHLCLSHIGYSNNSFQAQIDRVFSSPIFGITERVPWKEIEANWLSTIGGPRVQFDARVASRRCTLGTGLDALSARRQELYAFTHSLIYLTDFGQTLTCLPRPVSAIISDAEMALASCLDNDDFDLAAEILLTWPYLRSEWSSAAAFSLSLLAEMERNIGFLPSLSLRQKTLQRMSKAQRARYVVSEGYHTAYVMGLLSAAILACETAPPKFPQQAEKAFGNYDFYPMLLPKRHKPRWEYQYTSLSKEQKFALSGFVSTIGLRRALVKCNFRRLREILIASIEYGLTLSPAVHQGSLLLGRFISND